MMNTMPTSRSDSSTEATEDICLTGVTTNNLRNLDVKIPLGKLTVVTGVSGSGKSSLVFDTLYAEAFRRYSESLSSFARQYLQALPKPGIEQVYNLPPAIAVKQQRSGTGNARSTVGTMTELNDLLRIIFSQRAKVHCLKCGQIVERDSGDSVSSKLSSAFSTKQAVIVSPLSSWTRVKIDDLRYQLESQGFGRVLLNGKIQKLAETVNEQIHSADIIVDRLELSPSSVRRLAEAARLSLQLGNGKMAAVIEGHRYEFSSDMRCCDIEYREPTTSLFSYNHPLGACQTCQGFGHEGILNYKKIIPDRSQSLATGGVAAWNFGSHDEMYKWAKTSAKRIQLKVDKPFDQYTEAEWEWIKHGDAKGEFTGVEGYFRWMDTQKHKTHYRIHVSRFRRYVICSECAGGRLNRIALACRVADKTFVDVSGLPISAFRLWLDEIISEEEGREDRNADGIGFKESHEEASVRSAYLEKIGVGYLSLSRQARTLSGGEAQRIHMARCLGSSLTDTLYCLDEPTCGLHASDSANLLELLNQLRDQGNTVVAVEHDRTVINGADYLIEIGPAAGHLGGQVTTATDAEHYCPSAYRWPKVKSSVKNSEWIRLSNVKTHNLKGVNVEIPVGQLTTVCGVSGSGKTSLIQHSLYPLIHRSGKVDAAENLDEFGVSTGELTISGNVRFGKAILVSQTSIGRSSRSNIATYLGIYDSIRKLYASQNQARDLELTPSSFSFNTSGGRCENCRGLGVITEDLSFLGEMEVVCPVCDGRRFDAKVLSVRYKSRNLIELLKLTIVEAREFFADYADICRGLDAAISMGLGYLTLGQSTSSFSGGEAQRLKLVKLVFQDDSKKPSLLIFDEPSTGLSDTDVGQLLGELRRLTQAGHTVIVVEHHLGVIQASDWVIEVGPGPAAKGGSIVHMGSFESMMENTNSITRPFIEKEIENEQN
jgi:excinuclease ABC subunit A